MEGLGARGMAGVAILVTLSLSCSAARRADDEPEASLGTSETPSGKDQRHDVGTPTLLDAGSTAAPAPGTSVPGSPLSSGPGPRISATITADRATATNAVVSGGLPFPPGLVKDERQVRLLSAQGTELPLVSTVLARWPIDGSIRSLFVATRVSLSRGASQDVAFEIGVVRSASSSALAPNPDGPVALLFSADWLTKSRVSGVLLPVAANQRFATYDSALRASLSKIDYDAFGNNCGTTSNHRTYYDGPHALYQLYLRSGTAGPLRRAREEAVWYRQNELTFYESRRMAVQSCQGSGWTPSRVLDQSVIRRMLGQGMLDDYLLTGDPEAREAVLAMGEAFRRNLPALTAGARPAIEVTERNLAWTLMGLASAYAIDPRADLRSAVDALVSRIESWQSRATSGALEHDIARADPEECSDGPNGGSPFMTSLVVDALMDVFALTGDTRVREIVRKLAVWYETRAVTSDKLAFRYLWNCKSDGYDDSDVADLNLLIVHTFGAAYALTQDGHWLAFGDAMADSGIDAMFASRPKQWNQAARSFGRYLGYRAQGRTP